MMMLKWAKRIDDEFDDDNIHADYRLFREYLTNAIDAGLLPAIEKKESGRTTRALMDAKDVPADIQKFVSPTITNRWVYHSDLIVFAESDRDHSNGQWAHSRSVTAKVCRLLAQEAGVIDDLQKHVAEIVSSTNTKGLGATTIRDCVKEILDSG